MYHIDAFKVWHGVLAHAPWAISIPRLHRRWHMLGWHTMFDNLFFIVARRLKSLKKKKTVSVLTDFWILNMNTLRFSVVMHGRATLLTERQYQYCCCIKSFIRTRAWYTVTQSEWVRDFHPELPWTRQIASWYYSQLCDRGHLCEIAWKRLTVRLLSAHHLDPRFFGWHQTIFILESDYLA